MRYNGNMMNNTNTTVTLLLHPCWGKRYLYTPAELAVMDAEFTEAVAKETAECIVRDNANFAKLEAMMADGSFHHATYRHDISPGWHIYSKADHGFRGFTYAMGFGEKSHVADAVSELVRTTGYSVGSYGLG